MLKQYYNNLISDLKPPLKKDYNFGYTVAAG
jgi:hypothetical protein